MAVTTLRTTLNRVLTAIGETTIAAATTTIADALPLKLLEFANEFKEEIEDATYWRALRQTISVTVTANTNNAGITGTDGRARVIRVPAQQAGQLVPLVFDVTVPTNPIQLIEMPLAELLYRTTSDGTGVTTVQPDHFAVDVSGDQAQLYVYPTPSTQRTINVAMQVPQATLLTTDLDTAIKIPTLPLLKATIWFALMDRGEEMGANGAFTEERYRTSLDDAISRDSAEAGTNDVLVVV